MANAARDITGRATEQLVGSYRLSHCLGEGRVWSARHAELGHPVVLKLLPSPSAAQRRARPPAAFGLGAAAEVAARSENLCRILDFGESERHGQPFVVLEALVGETLQERLRREPQLPFDVARDITLQLARALAVVHAAGIVHGAIKPSNIFLCTDSAGATGTSDGAGPLRVKLLGLGQTSLETSERDSSPEHLVIGSPLYMSPELLLHGRADGQSDLWSLASVFYRMIVGATPFGTGSLVALFRRIGDGDMRAPSGVPGLPAGIDSWMRRALAQEPTARFSSAMAFRDALERLTPRMQSCPTLRVAPVVMQDLADEDEGAERTIVRAPSPNLLQLAALPISPDGRPSAPSYTPMPATRPDVPQAIVSARKVDATTRKPALSPSSSVRCETVLLPHVRARRFRRAAFFALVTLIIGTLGGFVIGSCMLHHDAAQAAEHSAAGMPR